MPEPNRDLPAARIGTASPYAPGQSLSRAELAELAAAEIHRRTGREAPLDGHYVAKLERGVIGWPSGDYREALRSVLGAASDREMGFTPPRGVAPALPPAPLAVLAGLAEDDGEEWDRLAEVIAAPHRVEAAVVGHLARLLAEQRLLEDLVGARRVLPAALAEIELVDALGPHARDGVRAELLELASQWRQFAGWMGEDTGQHAAALAHYDRAMEAAQETGDANMVTSVLSLKSHLAWSVGDGARAVGLAHAGQRDEGRVSPGVLALIVQQEARGHALNGEGDPVDRLLDRTMELTERAREHPEDEPPWVYFQAPERVAFQRGVAYVELGRYAAAAELFEAARAGLPASYRRDHGRYAANLALAAALDGQVERALAAGREALAVAVDTGSAHTMADLRRARRALERRGAGVAELDEYLAEIRRQTRHATGSGADRDR